VAQNHAKTVTTASAEALAKAEQLTFSIVRVIASALLIVIMRKIVFVIVCKPLCITLRALLKALELFRCK